MNKCQATKMDGNPCKGNALENGFCVFHQPSKKKPPKKLKVFPEEYFSDGTIENGNDWAVGEVREVTMEVFRQLRESAPGIWMVKNV